MSTVIIVNVCNDTLIHDVHVGRLQICHNANVVSRCLSSEKISVKRRLQAKISLSFSIQNTSDKLIYKRQKKKPLLKTVTFSRSLKRRGKLNHFSLELHDVFSFMLQWVSWINIKSWLSHEEIYEYCSWMASSRRNSLFYFFLLIYCI